MQRPLLLLTVALTAFACSDSRIPTATLTPSGAAGAALVGGSPAFYWLPPLAKAPSPTGTFDPALSPVVRISEWPGSQGALVAEFSMSSGPGSETVRLDAEGEFYIVNWHTREVALNPALNYRIRVLVDGFEVGFADVDVVASAKELKTVDAVNYFGVLNGRTVPIKFRIEEGAVDASLTLVKKVLNDDAGTAAAADFTLSASGPTPISGPGGVSSGAGFQPGTYTLSESGPSGYAASAWTCTDGTLAGNQLTLAVGDVAVCEITNNDPGQTSISLVSDAGDFIGQGKTYNYTQANARITATTSGGHFHVKVEGDEFWDGDFEVPSTLSSLQTGTYAGATRYPFNGTGAGLNWSGEGRGCGSLTGSFTITRATYINGQLTAVELTFEQRCGVSTAALRGEIKWNAHDPTLPPDPVNPIPATLWQPAAGATPATGNFVHMSSSTGDFIGQGQTNTYTAANATITVTSNQGLFKIVVKTPPVGSTSWTGEFKTMYTLDQLQVGYYPDLQRYPFHNPAKGGLSWSGFGRGCNNVRGWFAVDRVAYSGGVLTGIDLRFEQFCDANTVPLHGAIRWDAGP